MRRISNIIRTDDVPLMSRRNYVIELRHLMAWGMFSGIVEGNISTIVVAKTFGGSDFLATTVWSIPFLANMLMVFRAGRSDTRPKLGRLITLGLCAVVAMASIVVTPSEYAWGGWLFAAQLLATRFFLAGVVAVRTSIWNANYPREHRARLVARLQGLRFLVGLMIAASVSFLFDFRPEFYRYVYPAIACVGVIALLLARRIRVRGEPRELARARDRSDLDDHRRGLLGSLRHAVQVLRDDRRFARYCTAQFFLGSANFMIEPLLTLTLIQTLGFGYFWATGMMDIVPTFVMLLAMQYWAPHFDRVGVVQFRVVNSAVWVSAFSLAAVSMLFVTYADQSWAWITAVSVLLVARVLAGIARGGGAIAWHIGHLHFAKPDNAESYMRVHMALTGLRGILFPQLSRLLNQSVGNWSFAVAVLSGVVGMVLYQRLARDDRRETTAAEAEAERSTPQTVRSEVT